MEIRKIAREEWLLAITNLKEDRFAKTFLGKADARDYWDKAYGCFINGELAGGIITTYSKKEPKIANLQLLHTFYAYRGKGIGKQLTEQSVQDAFSNQCKYYRVSAEPKAVAFYEKIGFRFWGKQKSGTSLSFFKITSDKIHTGLYDLSDITIYSKVHKDRGCIYETK
jgi:ribosomal protein S18 acetylase RimI-like enzyme